MVVFGGITTNGNVNDLWNLDLSTYTWSPIPHTSAVAPAPRATHLSMYDAEMNRMIIWSGQGSVLYNDVWAFNFADSTWQELFPDGNVGGAPLKRYGTATVFDPINRSVITFAGFTTSGRFDDTWGFDVDQKSWTNRSNLFFPLERCLTSQSFAPDRREMIVFGGQQNGNLNDLWTLNTDTYSWTDRTPTFKPSARHFSSNSYCGQGNVVVFGGNTLNQGNKAGAVNDLWLFSLDAAQWDTLPQGANRPLPRFGHTSIYLPDQDKLLVFGGQGTSSLFNDVWEYSGISGIINSVEESKTEPQALKVIPNPSGAERNISFYIPTAEVVKISVHDMTGKRVLSTQIKELEAGKQHIQLNDPYLTPGAYTITISSKSFTESTLLIVSQF